MTVAAPDASTFWWSGSMVAAVACLLLLVLGPTAAWMAWYGTQGRRGAPAVAAGLAVGMATWVLVASVLVRLGALTTATVWSAVAAVTAASLVVIAIALRRRRQRDTPRTATPPGSRARALRIALLPVVLVGITVPQLVGIFQRPFSLVSPTAWYYWLVTQGVAGAGGIPAQVFEWGESFEPFTFHFGFTSAGAMLAVASDRPGTLVAAQLVRICTVLLFVVGVWLLCCSLGAPSEIALVGAAVASCVEIFAIKLSSYRPEALAYGLAFITVALVVWGLKERDRAYLWASGVGVVALFQLHGLTALLAVALIGGIAAAHLLTEENRSRRELLDRLRTLAGYALLCGGSIAITNFAFTAAVSEASAASGVPDMADGYDPTWAFAELVTSGKTEIAMPGTDAPTDRQLALDSLDASLLGLPVWLWWSICAVTLVAAVLLARHSLSVRRSLVFGVVSFLLLLGAAFVLSTLGDTYVPRRTGFSRLLQLWPVVPICVATTLVSWSQGWARRVGAAACLLLGLIVWTAQVGPALTLGHGEPDSEQLVDVRSLPIRPGALVLTNAYTQGFIQVQTPGVGLLDGQAPYLDADLLARANGILTRARAYFQDPAASPFPFERYKVSYVLVAKQPFVLGTSVNFFPLTADQLERDPRLRVVRSTENLVLYEVAR